MQTNTTTTPSQLRQFYEALNRARQRARTRPARVTDNTAAFPAAVVRRLQIGLPARPRGENLDLV